jgi:hypothetical protein
LIGRRIMRKEVKIGLKIRNASIAKRNVISLEIAENQSRQLKTAETKNTEIQEYGIETKLKKNQHMMQTGHLQYLKRNQH